MKRYMLILGMALCIMQGYAQSSTRQRDAFDEFRRSIHQDFEDFRKKIVEDYIAFLSDPWQEKKGEKPVPKPKDDPVPVVPYVAPLPDETPAPAPEPAPVVIEEVITPPAPPVPPTPVLPVKNDNDNDDGDENGDKATPVEHLFLFSLWGTEMGVHLEESQRFTVEGCQSKKVANTFSLLLDERYDPLFADCLRLREDYRLCDWAYLQMLKNIADKFCGQNTNEAELLLASLVARSGYKMRLATDNQRLYMLFACQQLMFDKAYYNLDGTAFFSLHDLPSQISISDARFKGEQQLTLQIPESMRLATSFSEQRTIVSRNYADVRITSTVNKNLMDFYNTYPSSQWGDNFVTKWAMYANTPLDSHLQSELYPQLRQRLVGKNKLAAVEILLNWVQTGFEYEYDDKVWGHDRAFFAEESIYYPYCDCEDRSILFTRLVRDLLGLPCILVYYPGHLAAAVHFDTSVEGDYIELEGRRFTVADPTYIGASVGLTMPGMDNSHATVILLR